MSRAETITLVGDHPPPYGGVAVHVQSLHARLAEAGIRSTVLDIGKGSQPGVGVISARGPLELAKALAVRLRAGDRLHVHISGNNAKAWQLAGGAAAMFALARRRPVLTVHSGLFPKFAERWSHRAVVCAALAGYARIIAVSPAIADALGRCGVDRAKLRVIPAFLAPRGPVPAAPEAVVAARRAFKPLLAFAHHPSPVYGTDFFLEAIRALSRELPEVGAVAFGPGLTPGRELGPRVRGLGELTHPEARATMAVADLFVRPTTADGDAISIRDALALGTRCLASDAAVRPPGVQTFHTGSVTDFVRAARVALSAPAPAPASFDAGPVILDLYAELSRLEESRAPLRVAV